ncbi:MAG: methyltransferase domain-containing protein [Chromatiales bacterium]|nr:methyltransferase domain-containing protein [Chromatiales bacterium]
MKNSGGSWAYRLRRARFLRGHAVALSDRPLPAAKITVVIPVYTRPQNLPHLLRAPLACPFVERIVISNSNTAIDVRAFIPYDDPRIVAINEPRRFGVGVRWLRCAEHPAEFYLSFDDDVFLSTAAIYELVERLLARPGAPAGIRGGRFLETGERWVGTGPVDTLWGVFCFTRAQLDRCIAIAGRLGIDLGELRNGEDVLLSLAGDMRPEARWHDNLFCHSYRSAEAIHKREDGFDSQRRELHARTLRLVSRGGELYRAPSRLHLGCGTDPRFGYWNVDIAPLPQVDVQLDLARGRLPFADASIDEVLCIDILEHLDRYPELLAEIHRVLKPGGTLHAQVPHFSCWCAYADPTHRRLFSIETFGFFAGDVGRDYYFDFRFAAIRELRLTFESGRWLVRRVARWVNADVGHMRRWERTALARLFPAMNIVAELVR